MSRIKEGFFISLGFLTPGSLALSALLLALGLSSACTHVGHLGQGLPAEEAVSLRAQAWADALLSRDMQTAYSFTTPNYREYSSSQRYSSMVAGSLRWTAAEVESVQCDEDVCTARVVVDYEIKRHGIKNRRPLDYKWLNVDGLWWLYVSPE